MKEFRSDIFEKKSYRDFKESSKKNKVYSDVTRTYGLEESEVVSILEELTLIWDERVKNEL